MGKEHVFHRSIYHHSTGPSPDCDIEAYIVEHIQFPEGQCTYCDTIRALPLNNRLITSVGRSGRRNVVPLLVLHTHSHPLILVVEVFVVVIYPSPNFLLLVAGNHVRSMKKAIGKSCWIGDPEACMEESNREKVRGTYKKLLGNIKFGGTNMSSKKSSRTVLDVIKRVLLRENGDVLFMPYTEALLICPRMISPLKGRKTIRRNSTGDFQHFHFRSRSPLTYH